MAGIFLIVAISLLIILCAGLAKTQNQTDPNARQVSNILSKVKDL
jgi:uncharacterized protein YoxC